MTKKTRKVTFQAHAVVDPNWCVAEMRSGALCIYESESIAKNAAQRLDGAKVAECKVTVTINTSNRK